MRMLEHVGIRSLKKDIDFYRFDFFYSLMLLGSWMCHSKIKPAAAAAARAAVSSRALLRKELTHDMLRMTL